MGSSSGIGVKALLALGATVVAVIGVAGIAAFFAARDEATVPQHSDGPGSPRAVNARPEVKPGNVVLRYSDERLTRELRTFASEVAGEPTPALAAAGQAVLVQREPNLTVPVTALSASHRLEAGGPRDRALQSFVEYWLGRAP